MSDEHRDRLLALSHEAGMLASELSFARDGSSDKAMIRGVLRHLEKATEALELAVLRAEAA